MSFEFCLGFVLQEEGGFSDDVHDPGGATNFGITQRTYDHWRLKKSLNTQSVKLLTQDEVKTIYKEEYWDANNLEAMSEPWQLFLFDSYVQHRPATVHEFIAGGASVEDALWARVAYYAELNNFLYFGRGWIHRMCRLRKALKGLNAVV